MNDDIFTKFSLLGYVNHTAQSVTQNVCNPKGWQPFPVLIGNKADKCENEAYEI